MACASLYASRDKPIGNPDCEMATPSELLKSEAAHQDRLVAGCGGAPIRHATMERFAGQNPLSAAFAAPYLLADETLRVLDLGCGTGGATIRLARRGHHVTAVDISPASLELVRATAEAEQLTDRVTTELCDATEIAARFKGRHFDAVCGVGVLHHLVDIDGTLAQIASLGPRIVTFIEAVGTNPLYQLVRWVLARRGGSHTIDEHPLTGRDFASVRRYFPGVVFRFGGAVAPIPRLRVGPMRSIDNVVSNAPLLRRLSKTVSFVWQGP